MRFFVRPAAVLGFAALIIPIAGCAGGGAGGAGQPVSPGFAALPAMRTQTVTPASAATSASGVPAHIATMAYDEYGAEGRSASSASVQQYLTYAEGGEGNDKAVVDCDQSATRSCYSVFYLDPNFVYASASCPGTIAAQVSSLGSESWFVHEAGYTDSAHRAHGSYSQYCQGREQTIPVYWLNENNTAVQSYFSSYIHQYAAQWDTFFMDDTSGSVLTQGYGPGGGFCPDSDSAHYCYSTQEYANDAAVVAAHAAFVDSLNRTNGAPATFFFNGISFSHGQPQNLTLFQSSNRFTGITCEECIIDNNLPRPTMYAEVLTAMAQIDQIPGASFIELNTGTQSAGAAIQQRNRRIVTAVAWLGYADGHTIDFANLEDDTTNLAVWPEQMIYPSQPVQTMTSSANDIMVAPGVYRREFAQCYDAGQPIGQCAAFLNANTTSVTIQSSWMTQSYKHILQLAGGDVLSGGSLGLTDAYYAPGRTTIPPDAAELLVK